MNRFTASCINGLSLSLLSLLPLPSSAQQAMPHRPPLPHQPVLACCGCAGGTTTLDLSTGQGSPIDPFWKVNNGPAYTTTALSAWKSMPPAKWIQPTNASDPSPNVNPGTYRYTMSFFVEKCENAAETQLAGMLAADNSATMYLDGVATPIAVCPGPKCFAYGAAFSRSISPGQHTLTVDVKNDESYSGLIVHANVTRHCHPTAALKPDFQLTASTIQNSTDFHLTANQILAPISGSHFAWRVEELPANNNVIGPPMSNPAVWWVAPYVLINTVPTFGGTSPMGTFKQGHKYRITRGVWGNACQPWVQVSKTVFVCANCRTAEIRADTGPQHKPVGVP